MHSRTHGASLARIPELKPGNAVLYYLSCQGVVQRLHPPPKGFASILTRVYPYTSFDPVRAVFSVGYKLLATAVSGLEAAFKTESRATGLKSLAARCQVTIFQIDTQWQNTVGWHEDRSEDVDAEKGRIKAAQTLLGMQDQVLGDVQLKAAEFGVNVAFEVRQLYGSDPPALA